MHRPARKAPSGRRFRSALSSERVAHLVKHAFRGTSRALTRRLNAHHVSYSHWTLLRVLWQSDGLTQRELSDRAGVTEPSTYAAVHAMEELGYVTREKMPDNHKEVRVFLTPRGAALREASVSAAEDVNRIALHGIPAGDIATVRRTLLAMIENLEHDEALAPRARRKP
ncbi:MAG TPA: MarR family transcriptional regulator [Casimicrobiaceae bacterium]|nr:MarR family transcriptional regulator [Casimicrobiaceae bacterium]